MLYGLSLSCREDVGVVCHEVDVDRLDVAGPDEPQARVARCRDDVELVRVGGEQAERLVGRAEDLDRSDLQPVASSNGVTQSTVGSVEPFST